MRMWNVPVEFMCRKHLLGEHVELHMLIGTIKKGNDITGYLDGLVEVDKIVKRHKEIVREMKRRGYNHKTPIKLRDRFMLWWRGREGIVFSDDNVVELRKRCSECRF